MVGPWKWPNLDCDNGTRVSTCRAANNSISRERTASRVSWVTATSRLRTESQAPPSRQPHCTAPVVSPDQDHDNFMECGEYEGNQEYKLAFLCLFCKKYWTVQAYFSPFLKVCPPKTSCILQCTWIEFLMLVFAGSFKWLKCIIFTSLPNTAQNLT